MMSYRYDDTKVVGFQLPFVKTAQPLVRRMTMHMKRPKYEL